MSQEDKELLLKDICARLPYGVICTDNRHGDSRVFNVDAESKRVYYTDFDECGLIENCKSYLRPMSSMTKEEKKELLDICSKETSLICEQLKNGDCGIENGKYHFNSIFELDFVLFHHFDYRGLIEKGLALEAPEDIYKTKLD